MGRISFEIPRRAVPNILTPIIGDHHDPAKLRDYADWMPPGHRFLLYFHSLADTGAAEYEKGDNRQQRLRKWAEKANGPSLLEEVKEGRAELEHEKVPLKNGKRHALEAVAKKGTAADRILRALQSRQGKLTTDDDWICPTQLTSPLFTGGGNPHPVENGYAFLSPYGIPYLAGSGVKGVLRRAAEELALFSDDHHGWDLVRVWTLFGFEEKSSHFTGDGDSEWRIAYDAWVQKAAAEPDELLELFVQLFAEKAENGSPQDLLQRLAENTKFRSNIHYQGLLVFHDAYPEPPLKMGVDILNPHHKQYYQADEQDMATPHDADQPIPVFFLVLKPGTKFTLRAGCLSGREDIMRAVGDWKKLLDAAFDHAADWLGFGSKTSVGYGALVRERKTPDKDEARSGGDPQREKRLEQEADKKAQRKEQEREALPESTRTLLELKEFVSQYRQLIPDDRKSKRSELNQWIKKLTQNAPAWESIEDRKEAASILREALDEFGWTDPGKKGKQRQKQIKKRQQQVNKIWPEDSEPN